MSKRNGKCWLASLTPAAAFKDKIEEFLLDIGRACFRSANYDSAEKEIVFRKSVKRPGENWFIK